MFSRRILASVRRSVRPRSLLSESVRNFQSQRLSRIRLPPASATRQPRVAASAKPFCAAKVGGNQLICLRGSLWPSQDVEHARISCVKGKPCEHGLVQIVVRVLKVIGEAGAREIFLNAPDGVGTLGSGRDLKDRSNSILWLIVMTRRSISRSLEYAILDRAWARALEAFAVNRFMSLSKINSAESMSTSVPLPECTTDRSIRRH